jgi:ribosomal-protein-alanine N-acetyltransferase
MEYALHLESARLTFRPVRHSDVEDLYRIYGDPATNTFNPAGPYPSLTYTQAVLERWIAQWARDGFGQMAIATRLNPHKIIGFAGLSVREFDGETVNNLGYRFATEAWGQGFATEASLRLTRFGFEELKLKKISAAVRENHLDSLNVLEKSGLRRSGKVTDVKDAPASLVFTITSDQWFERPV